MPLIHYSCECKTSYDKFFRAPKEAPLAIVCVCGKDAKKTLRAPSSASIITVDNGVQARATEINIEVIEDIKNRSTKNFGND
jgi:hypothetical protein